MTLSPTRSHLLIRYTHKTHSYTQVQNIAQGQLKYCKDCIANKESIFFLAGILKTSRYRVKSDTTVNADTKAFHS